MFPWSWNRLICSCFEQDSWFLFNVQETSPIIPRLQVLNFVYHMVIHKTSLELWLTLNIQEKTLQGHDYDWLGIFWQFQLLQKFNFDGIFCFKSIIINIKSLPNANVFKFLIKFICWFYLHQLSTFNSKYNLHSKPFFKEIPTNVFQRKVLRQFL